MRPSFIIGLDVDEVLGDLHTPWVAWGNEKFHCSNTVEEFNHWDKPIEWWGPAPAYNAFLTSEIYDKDIVKPYDGALVAVNVLRERGHEIRFVTSTMPGTESAKFEWLVRHGFLHASDEYIPVKDKSNAPCHLLVDDGYHNVTTFNGWAILVTRPHNRREQWYRRINHVSDLLNIL